MKHLKLFFALFAMLALGVGNAWGAEATLSSISTKNVVTTKGQSVSTTFDDVTCKVTRNSGNQPGFYTSSGIVRYYSEDVMTLSVPSGNTITKVVFTMNSGNVGTVDVGTVSNNTWTGNAESISFTGTGTVKITKIVVTYEATSGGQTPEPDPTPDPGTGGEETTVTYVLKDDLNHPANGVDWLSGTIDQYTGWTATKGGSNNPKYYDTGSGLRVYNGGEFTITSTKIMTSITLTFSGTGYTFSADNATTPQTVTPNAKSYKWSVSRTCRLQKIEITYAADAGGNEETVVSVKLTPDVKDFGTVNVGETPSQEFTITTENTTAALTASIDDDTNYAISDIVDNKMTVTYQPQSAGTHSAVLTVKAGEEATATVNLTGKAVQALEGTWILVTDASSLNVGDKIIIAAKESDVALSTTQAGNNRPEVAITKNDNTITATSETQVLTLQAGNKENTLALYTGDGYLYAASSSSNYLRTETTLSDNSSWNITVAADGTATLIAQGTNTKNTLYYNKNSKIFSCYSSAQQPIAIYKNTNGKQLAGLAYATTKYLTKLGDAFTTPTLTNPNSLTVTYSSSDNNVATVDNTGTVTIKAAGAVVITAAFTGDASYLEGSAKYTICVTEHAGTEADPYSVADARRVIDVMETAEGVYATGIVSEIVTAYNSEYGNITYNISIDGSTAADQLQAYRGKGVNGENFSSANDIKVGDEVVVKGNLKKYETTYEFDADNQLVSLKRDKQQAGLAYEEKEHTANVGEDFTEPALTNPNSLTVTYSSSNTALATVDATTGEVSILAAGKVTIIASSAADATYAAGSASYNITITDPSLAVATLPFYFDGKKADIEGTAGMTQSNLGTDYTAAPYLKFNEEGAWAIVQFDSEPGEFSFLLKQNGSSVGTFTVYESANGEDYTPIWSGGDLGGNGKSTTIKPTLSATSRYVKFEYTTKPSGTNYGLGSISIAKPDLRQEAGIAWSAETTTITIGDAFTVPTLSNPNGLTGITFTSDNTELATVNDAGVITMKEGITGKAVITANFAGNEDYKSAEVTTTIIVSPETGDVVILAKHQGQWYAMKAEYVTDKTDRLAAVAVNYVGGKLYNVSEEDKAAITWTRSVYGDKVSFQNDGKYLKGKTSTTLILEANEDGLYQWNANDNTMLIGETSRTFIYHKDGMFRNYDVQWASPTSETYSDFPVVTAPVYATAIEINGGDNSTVIGTNKDQTVNVIVDRSFEEGDEWYTLCVPFNMPASVIGKAYQISGLVQKTADYVEVYLAEKTTIVAGEPYLIKPTVTVDKFVVENATIVNTTGASISKSISGLSVTMQGVINGNGGTTDGLYWVGNGGLLYNDTASKSGLRAYFNITTSSGIAPRMRVVAGENVETGVEDIITTDAPVKVIENGQLVIIRDGVKYNVQGQKL